jgi:hypothetical protein
MGDIEFEHLLAWTAKGPIEDLVQDAVLHALHLTEPVNRISQLANRLARLRNCGWVLRNRSNWQANGQSGVREESVKNKLKKNKKKNKRSKVKLMNTTIK